MDRDVDYMRYLLEGWDKKFLDRKPAFCAKCRCKQLTFDDGLYGCALIHAANAHVKERVVAQKYPYTQAQRELLNEFYPWTEEDYFPLHKVPPKCEFMLEYMVQAKGENGQGTC
jgi:hypothetical protein